MNNPTLIKICGIRDAATARASITLGADFIGLVFHPKSSRYLTVPDAQIVSEACHAAGGKSVGIFVNHSPSEIIDIAKKCSLDFVQLHGHIALKSAAILPLSLKKFYVSHKNVTTENIHEFIHYQPQQDFILYDSTTPGTGKRLHIDINPLSPYPFFIAGGLTPENTEEAIQRFQPLGVDVSSGVESSPGIKDLHKIEKFIRKAKAC